MKKHIFLKDCTEGKASYVECNQELINKSAFCVVYYDETYSPPRRKNSCREFTDYQGYVLSSGVISNSRKVNKFLCR